MFLSIIDIIEGLCWILGCIQLNINTTTTRGVLYIGTK